MLSKKEKKALGYKAVMLFLLMFNACLILLVSLGWFTNNRTVETDGVNLEAISIDNNKFTVDAYYKKHGTDNDWQVFSGTLSVMHPDDCVTIRLKIDNNNDTETSQYTISFEGIMAEYPVSVADDIIVAGPYVGADSFEPTSEYFSEFIRPVSNALKYRSVIISADDITLASEKTAVKLVSDYLTDAGKPESIISGEPQLVAESEEIVASANCVIAANAYKYVYITLYFDPTKYSTATIDGSNIEMQNSNAYIDQEMTITSIKISGEFQTTS